MSADAALVEDAVETPPGVSIASHPRARAWIGRARARVALVAFGLVLVQALHAGVPAQEAVVRALVAGIAGNLAAWAVGLLLWKQIVLAEVRSAYVKREQRRRAAAEAAAERRAAAAAQV